MCIHVLKYKVHWKMKILSLFTHPTRVKDWHGGDFLMMSLLLFWVLNVSVALLSMQGQKALGFHPKYINLYSKDEWRSYRFGMTWEWVIDDRIFIFGWTVPVYLKDCLLPGHFTPTKLLENQIKIESKIEKIENHLKVNMFFQRAEQLVSYTWPSRCRMHWHSAYCLTPLY